MKRVLLALIRFYRKRISPLKAPCCRFTPTCSQYALTAIERFGAIRGTGMALWRLLRCGPWCPGGYDPVPEKKLKKKHNKFCSMKHENKTEYDNEEAGFSDSPASDHIDMNHDSASDKE